jgi:hypothetical protein
MVPPASYCIQCISKDLYPMRTAAGRSAAFDLRMTTNQHTSSSTRCAMVRSSRAYSFAIVKRSLTLDTIDYSRASNKPQGEIV